jgi:hypothetical protein
LRAGEERPRRSDERSDLGECQGWLQSLRVVATQARTARRSSQDGGIFSREALAPVLPARPWPNLRGDGRDECRAGARADHKTGQDSQKAGSAVLTRKALGPRYEAIGPTWVSASGGPVEMCSPTAPLLGPSQSRQGQTKGTEVRTGMDQEPKATTRPDLSRLPRVHCGVVSILLLLGGRKSSSRKNSSRGPGRKNSSRGQKNSSRGTQKTAHEAQRSREQNQERRSPGAAPRAALSKSSGRGHPPQRGGRAGESESSGRGPGAPPARPGGDRGTR